GIRIDVGHPVERPLIGGELRRRHRHLEKRIRLTARRIHEWARLVSEPAVVVERGRADDRVVRLGRFEVAAAPVGRELADEAGVVGLSDEGERAARFLPDDHDAPNPFSTSAHPASATGRARRPRSRALGSLAVPATTRPMIPWAMALNRNIAKAT